jgi:hypothetical protein
MKEETEGRKEDAEGRDVKEGRKRRKRRKRRKKVGTHTHLFEEGVVEGDSILGLYADDGPVILNKKKRGK